MSGHTRRIPLAERDKIINMLRDTLNLMRIFGVITRQQSRTTFSFKYAHHMELAHEMFNKIFDAFNTHAFVIKVNEAKGYGDYHVVIMWNAREVPSDDV